MKICIYGAGAIGGWITARFVGTDHDVSCVGRGETYAVIRRDGLRVQNSTGEQVYRLPITDDPSGLGEQDLVIIAVRSTELLGVIESVQPLLGKDTSIITLCKGIPWWYFYGCANVFEQPWLEAVDPGGVIWDAFGPERALGCIAYPSVESSAPGIVEHQFGQSFTLGEPDGTKSPRLKAVRQAFSDAGFSAVTVKNIRQNLWLRLMASTSFSLFSVITRKRLSSLLENYHDRREIMAVMNDVMVVARALNIRPAMSPKELLEVSVLLGANKARMLQDMELGKPLELDALVGAIRELGIKLNIDTPELNTAVLSAVEQARSAGCYTAAE
jgi:2-dehydropantoate 2-reductase